MLEETNLQLMHTSSNDIRRGHIGSHYPCKEQIAATQTKIERSMLNITYRDRKTITWVREKTKVTDVIEQVRRRTWTWTGRVSRIRDNRWTLRITTWKPYDSKRHRERPARRWRDELDDYWKDTIWQRIAQDR